MTGYQLELPLRLPGQSLASMLVSTGIACPRLHCHMSRLACLRRQGFKLEGGAWVALPPRERDAWCGSGRCEVGKGVALEAGALVSTPCPCCKGAGRVVDERQHAPRHGP